MANIKSQIKRIKTNEKARLRNKAVKSSLKTSVRKFREAAAAGERDSALEAMQVASRQLDKAASKGVIHTQPGRQPQVGDGQARRLALARPAVLRHRTRASPVEGGALRRPRNRRDRQPWARASTIATTARSRA